MPGKGRFAHSRYIGSPTVPPTPLRRRIGTARLSAATATAVPPITFPSTPLRVKVEVALGADLTADPSTWGWTDVTSMVYTRDHLTITRGRPDESTVADASKLEFTADNRGGHWSSRNPNSPWYGLLRKGTPIRVFAEGYPRYAGFISELPPRWDVSGNDRYAPIVAQGLLYRLAQGASPERSALRRTIAAFDPIAYWPLELYSLGSALPGQPAVTATSAVSVVAGPNGSDSVLDFTTGQVVRWTVPSSTETSWRVEFIFNISSTLATFPVLAQWNALGDIEGWQVTAGPAGSGGLGFTYISGGTSHGASSSVAVDDGAWHHVRVDAYMDTGQLFWTVYLDGVAVIGSPALGLTLGCVTVGILNPGAVTVMAGMGHLAVTAPYTAAAGADVASATSGYPGELAHVRFGRLCDEEGVPNTTGVTDSQAMGPQGVASLVPLLRDCEASDQGYLYESLDFGFTLQGHQERENQVVALALDYTVDGHVAPPLEPTDDDQQARNDVEVKRDGGSSTRLIEESTGVELSIPNIGRRDESTTLSLNTDDQTYHLAGWRLHIGTYPGYRYPVLSLNLAAGPSLISSVCAAGLGFRTTVANPPDDIGPDDPSVIVEGYKETLGPYDWDLQANCSIQGPWEVSVLAADTGDTDPHLGWLDFDTLTLDTAVSSSDVTWLIDAVPVDSTTGDDFPRPMICEGELITVTNCAGSSAPQTWTVTRSVNGIVRSHAAGAPITLAFPFVLAL